MWSSRKKPYPPQRRSSEIPRGRGVLKATILKAKYEAKLEFPGVMGCKTKNLSWGEYGYFLELYNLHYLNITIKKLFRGQGMHDKQESAWEVHTCMEGILVGQLPPSPLEFPV